jgi:hypothetical protein
MTKARNHRSPEEKVALLRRHHIDKVPVTTMDFVRELSERTEIAQETIIGRIGISRGKFFDWRRRYGKANEHNGLVPRDHWLEDEEERRIVEFHDQHPLEGYRRLTFMMIDQDVVAASPSSVYRVLDRAGRVSRWNRKPSFDQVRRRRVHPPARA